MMDELNFLLVLLLMLFCVLIGIVVHADNEQDRYIAAFTAECSAKGGVPQFNYRSTDLCLPAGTVIDMSTKQ